MMLRAVAVILAGLLALPATVAVAQPAPVAPPAPGPVLRGFDPPASRFGPGHRGVDVGAKPGWPVRAAMAGVVAFSGEVARVGWVTVDHGGGLDTTYGPLSGRRVVRGQRVAAGAVLGRLSAGADHVDWGARRNREYIDPLSLLVEWEIALVHPDDELPQLEAVVAAARSGRLRHPVRGVMTSRFGLRSHPLTGAHRMHAGVDFGAPAGTPVTAAASGKVVGAGTLGGYGNTVTLRHPGGVETRYAHLSSIAVSVGQEVVAGRTIGAVGSTGQSTGPHLHLEVRVGGQPVDPLPWLGR